MKITAPETGMDVMTAGNGGLQNFVRQYDRRPKTASGSYCRM